MFYYVHYHCKEGGSPSEIIEAGERLDFISGKHQSMSAGYATLEALKQHNQIQDNPCIICGQIFGVHYQSPYDTLLKEKGMCFSCNLWDERSKLLHMKKVMIVDHEYYTAHPMNTSDEAGFKGFGGRGFKFKRISDDSIVESNNVWFGGRIPPQFREIMKDNATFIKQTYNEKTT